MTADCASEKKKKVVASVQVKTLYVHPHSRVYSWRALLCGCVLSLPCSSPRESARARGLVGPSRTSRCKESASLWTPAPPGCHSLSPALSLPSLLFPRERPCVRDKRRSRRGEREKGEEPWEDAEDKSQKTKEKDTKQKQFIQI